jgi:membrane associated rhomboid family serine protease
MNAYVNFEERRYSFGDRITYAVQRLILINTVIFAFQLLLDIPFGYPIVRGEISGPPGGFIITWLGFQPSAFLNGALWKPVSYMFLHGGLMHLFLNMLWLFFFGPEVERTLGSRQFIRFYFLCGMFGVLFTFLPMLIWRESVSVFGASGAIMGVMVAYATINPEREFFLFPLPIPINARILVIIVIAMNVLTAIQGGSTSVATHFGGMIVGFVYMKLMPEFRKWQRMKWRRAHPKGSSERDPVAEAVDNIFKFDARKRGHWDK